MSEIPKAREMLVAVADALTAGTTTRQAAALALYALLPMLTRDSPVRRAPVKRRPVTRALSAQICAYARQHADAHIDEIAARFDVNPGRVSEILNGKR